MSNDVIHFLSSAEGIPEEWHSSLKLAFDQSIDVVINARSIHDPTLNTTICLSMRTDNGSTVCAYLTASQIDQLVSDLESARAKFKMP